jgi:hypothetical protein
VPEIEVAPTGAPPRATWRACGVDALAFHAVLLHLLRSSERPQAAVAVWSALILHADHNGTVAVQRADLARTAMVSPEAASRVLTDLVQLGAIARDGEGRTSRYRILRDAAIAPPEPSPAYRWSGSRQSAAPVEVAVVRHERAPTKTVYAEIVRKADRSPPRMVSVEVVRRSDADEPEPPTTA